MFLLLLLFLLFLLYLILLYLFLLIFHFLILIFSLFHQKLNCFSCKRPTLFEHENPLVFKYDINKKYIRDQKIKCPYLACKTAFNRIICPKCLCWKNSSKKKIKII